jgi:hypothetical protein
MDAVAKVDGGKHGRQDADIGLAAAYDQSVDTMLGEKTKQSALAEGGIDHAVNHTGRRHKSAKLRHKLYKVQVQSARVTVLHFV